MIDLLTFIGGSMLAVGGVFAICIGIIAAGIWGSITTQKGGNKK